MRLSIATKVFLGTTTVLGLCALLSGAVVFEMQRIGRGLSAVSTGYAPLIQAAGSLQTFENERERNTRQLLEEPDPEARARLANSDRTYFDRAMEERIRRLFALRAAASQGVQSAADREALGQLDARLKSLEDRLAEQREAASALQALGQSQDRADRLAAAQRRTAHELKKLVEAIQEQLNRGVAQAERQERAARWAIAALAGLAFTIGLFVLWALQRALAPIGRLTEAAQRLGRGSPETVLVPEAGGDELAVLAREFNAMAQRLAARERELRASGEALVRSERLAAIGRVAAQITHEIRNPLSSIGLNAEELRERLAEPDGEPGRAEAAQGLCDAIAREVDRLAGITEEYLRFARLPKPQLAQADLNELLRDLSSFVRSELEAAGVALEQRLSPGLPSLTVDAGQLRQLLLNLLRNAKEAMPSGGTVTVSTAACADGGAVVEVRDTGPGIPPERLQRIFDPFFTTKERGTGLGLALSQEIAQEHGGQLTCSTGSGGTTFTLRLPPAGATLPEAAPAPSSAA